MKNYCVRCATLFLLCFCNTILVAQETKKIGELIPIAGNYEYALVKDKKANKAKSGTLVANSWERRDFNELTVLGKTDEWIKLNNSRVTLQPGVYRLEANIGAYRTHHTRIRLIEIDAAGNVIEANAHYGMSVHNHPDGYASVRPLLLVYLNLSKETTYEIHHIVRTTNGGTEARGLNSSSQNGNDLGDETYAQIEIIKFSTP
ncbi:MAG: hypothetical protein R2820_13950 [Cyclobacteriaceae bacterium]|nr:hypothetical protein [Cyclobacteriaceae bacterium]